MCFKDTRLWKKNSRPGSTRRRKRSTRYTYRSRRRARISSGRSSRPWSHSSSRSSVSRSSPHGSCRYSLRDIPYNKKTRHIFSQVYSWMNLSKFPVICLDKSYQLGHFLGNEGLHFCVWIFEITGAINNKFSKQLQQIIESEILFLDSLPRQFFDDLVAHRSDTKPIDFFNDRHDRINEFLQGRPCHSFQQGFF